ncbi:hypothetical protein FJT64_010975 [Amphibalanus amphitrite]|uniref:Uncharacterized protein n=1 Tax=Amphibalanus amphitrite TaxID=1232801 RepID=A0A6A4VK09_AMPAM|nr:hypothetical protein FJT64_010975 [Amphibalanus amphitrite]
MRATSHCEWTRCVSDCLAELAGPPPPADERGGTPGYLLDTCPDLAAQFLDQSPDLAEVRRTKRRAQRPFGLSLVELLTEHAVAFSLVDDAYSTMKPPGARTGNGDFLSKLRRLLSVITESKAESAGDALVHPAFPTPESSTGADSASQATTASQLTADGVSGAVDGDDPAVGGDWADTPTREAAAADTPAREAAAADCPDTAGQESPCNSLTLVLDEESGEEDMKDSEPGGGTGAVTQTHIASVKSTAEGDGQSVEKTRDCVGEKRLKSQPSGPEHRDTARSTNFDTARPSPPVKSESPASGVGPSIRSLRIIPTPLTEGVKTPSLNGSLGDIETPTSARQGGRRGARSRGRSGPRRATAPRRRLMAEIQRRVESPRTPLEPSRPKAEPTPSTQSTAADRCKPGTAGDEVGDGSTRSGGVCRTARGAARRAGRPAVTSSDPVDQSAPDHTHQPGVKRPAVEGSPGQPVKTTPGNAKHLLKSLDIMSFLSRVHSIGSN